MSITRILLDIDGVIKKRGVLIPGVTEQLTRILERGIDLKLVTNCSLHKLKRFGENLIPHHTIDIVDPIDVLAELATRDNSFQNSRCHIVGTKNIRAKVNRLGIKVSNRDTLSRINKVLLFEKANYVQDEITRVIRSILNGAKLYSAGLDRLFWYKGEVYPGVGAITEQIKYVTNDDPIILGKPSRRIFDLALDGINNYENVVFVGDDLNTDVLGARKIGLLAAFIGGEGLSMQDSFDIKPDFRAADLKGLLDQVL